MDQVGDLEGHEAVGVEFLLLNDIGYHMFCHDAPDPELRNEEQDWYVHSWFLLKRNHQKM